MVTGEGTVHLKSLFVDVRGALVDLEKSQLSAIFSYLPPCCPGSDQRVPWLSPLSE